MILIESAAEIDAVSGGGPLNNIKCTIGNKGLSCTGSAQDFMDVGFTAFDQLQDWGGRFGRWLYDATH